MSTVFFSAAARRSPVALIALAVAIGVVGGCNRSDAPAMGAADAKAKTAAPADAKATSGTNSTEKIRGRWLRPDGGYVLAIGAIDPEGRAEARYFNPNPINVAWARVRTDGGVVKVDVELRDTNYPGCLYKLNYLPETDRLVGTYFQAQMQETHEVAFIREPQ